MLSSEHLTLHDKQKEIINSTARFKVIRAGRKGGKTSLEIENIIFLAVVKAENLSISKVSFPTGRKVLYVAPTQDQARNIVWEALKARLRGAGKPNEQRLQMKVPNEDGSYTTIYVGGWENRENYRGLSDVIHITFDEVDTLKDFFISWKEIFRPMFLDTGGGAHFIGTPKKENPNLRRLEKEAEENNDWDSFHFTSENNPHLSRAELEALKKDYQNDKTAYRQEIMAEYVDNVGALFKYDALIDVFSNTITKDGQKYLIVDIADDGSDKTTFNFWENLESYRVEEFEHLNTEGIIGNIRDYASKDRIPYSNIAVDAIGVGAGVASSSLLDGIIAYKSTHQPIKTDHDIVKLPNVHYTKEAALVSEFRNLRSQCVFRLANFINNHELACSIKDVRVKERIIEELFMYQDVSKGDGKRMATGKDVIKEALGRSPDISDTFIMRMYFEIKGSMMPQSGEEGKKIARELQNQFMRNLSRQGMNSTK